MIRSYLFFFCATIFLVNCKERERRSIDSQFFSFEKELSAQVFSLPSDSIGRPAAMQIVDTLLILDDSNQEYLYKVIDLKSGAIVGHLGKVGKGPGEILQPTLFEIVQGKERTIGIYDRRSFKYSEVNVDTAIQIGNYISKITSGTLNSNYSWVSKLDADRYIGTGYFDKRYVISDKSGSIIAYALDYPYKNDFKNASNFDVAFAMQAILKVRPDGKRIVLATYSSPNIEIVSVENSKLSKLSELYYGQPGFVPRSGNGMITVDYNADNTWGFIDVSVTNGYIYLLYSGRSRKKDGSPLSIAKTVLVYTWEGKPLARYKLDRDVNSIAIDESNNRLYATSLDPAIVSYDLN